MESAEPSLQISHDVYVKDRVRFKIEAYRKKGNRYRWSYLLMASTATVGAATVPVLINLDKVDKIVPTLVSLLVTILVGLEGLLHLREHWRNYDLMKTYLRGEENLFRAGAGAYKNLPPNEAFPLFVERIESEIAKERTQTIDMRTARAAEQQPTPKPKQPNGDV